MTIMDKKFRRILDLVRRSGDRMIVTSPEGDDAFVVMALEDYEILMELEQFAISSQEEFEADRENLDTVPSPSVAPSGIFDVMQSADSEGPTWDLSAMSAAERSEVEAQFRAQTETQKPHEIKEEEPKIVPLGYKKNEDDDLGEEQFYLEPVE